jgi:hypothetical protein
VRNSKRFTARTAASTWVQVSALPTSSLDHSELRKSGQQQIQDPLLQPAGR